MNCAELNGRMDAYARNQLSQEENEAFEAHLSTCAECSAMLEAAEPGLSAVSELPRSIEPPAEVWGGVRERMVSRGRSSRRISIPAWMLSAAAVLLVAVSAGATALFLRSTREGAAGPQDGRTAGGSEIVTQYASATAELSAELVKARARLDPATFAVIERNLRVIDSALAESRRALAGDPGNQVLAQMVEAVWRQKMDFLRRVTAMAPSS